MELFAASRQWATRPADQRFQSLTQMLKVCKDYARTAVTKTGLYKDLRVEAVDKQGQPSGIGTQPRTSLRLIGRSDIPAKLTHWSFGQLSARAGAPASYLRTLPATLAAQNLNHGLKQIADEDKDRPAQLLFHQNGGVLLRAITSERYTRIWNWEVVERLIPLEALGWGHPRPIQLKGDEDPALYASDHDMFVFLVNESNRIKDGTSEGLARGFFVENSEVGASAFKLTTFLYRYVCQNHIVWDTSGVSQIRLRHVGVADERFRPMLEVELRKYADSSASDEEAIITRARKKIIGQTKEEVLDAIFGKRIAELSRRRIDSAYNLAEAHDEDGDPKSVWGMVQGITRLSQQQQRIAGEGQQLSFQPSSGAFADQRTQLDRAAGKVLEMVDSF